MEYRRSRLSRSHLVGRHAGDVDVIAVFGVTRSTGVRTTQSSGEIVGELKACARRSSARRLLPGGRRSFACFIAHADADRMDLRTADSRNQGQPSARRLSPVVRRSSAADQSQPKKTSPPMRMATEWICARRTLETQILEINADPLLVDLLPAGRRSSAAGFSPPLVLRDACKSAWSTTQSKVDVV